MRILGTITLLLGCLIKVSAQSSVQNCLGAIPICQSVYTQTTTFPGAGTMNELNATNQGCLTTGESNSVWYIFNTSTAGNIVFTITPSGSNVDLDFAIWDLTDKSCAAITAAPGLPPIRCNYASLANSVPGGLTGLALSSALPSYGAAGPSFSSAINATAGQTFALLINGSATPGSGYTIDFTGSTSQIQDNLPPQLKADTIPVSCVGPSSIKLLLSENVLCTSLASDGSDFLLSPAAATISGASSASCTAGGTFTNLITLNFSAPLPPGSYTLSIKTGSDGNTLIDNCGNAAQVGNSRTFVVNPPIQISVNTQFGCPGSNSGVITINGSGGQTPYTYKVNSSPYISNNTFTGLFAGSYTVSVKDNNSCIKDTVVQLIPASSIQINSLSVNNLTCYGVNTGSVTITASGGAPPLTYAIGVSPYSSSPTFTNLAPGNYILHVKDANNCIRDTLIFISSPGQLNFNNIQLTHLTCGQQNGAIQATAFGGVNPLQFSLNSGTYQSSGLFNLLAAGTYTLRVKDANNCIRDTIVNLNTIAPVLIGSLNVVQPGCTGSTGAITVNGTSGTLPYSYSLNGSAFGSNALFAALSSGTFTVVIKDANGCTASSLTLLTSPANLFFGPGTVVQPSCLNSGSIQVSGWGGTPPYQFALGAGAYSANSLFTTLVPGNYLVHIKDANGCIHDTLIQLNNFAVPLIDSLSFIQPSCSFPFYGSINVYASGGTPNLTYSINGGVFQSSPQFNTLLAGTFTITVKDATGCTVTTTQTLSQINVLSFINLNVQPVGCNGTPLGSIQAILGNGNAPYQYSLNGGPLASSGNFGGLNAGVYTVQGVDATGCTLSTIVSIGSSAILSINGATVTSSPCFNPGTGSIILNTSASAPPLTYSINPGGSSASGNFNGLSPGTYQIQITDQFGCQKDTTIQVTGAAPMSFTNVFIMPVPCTGGNGSISLSGTGGASPYTYSINGGAFGSTHNWPSLPGGTYTIQLKDVNGCLHDTIITLMIPPPVSFTSVVVFNTPCSGVPNGSISVAVTSGAPPYLYSLNGGVYSPVSSWSSLGVGSYHIVALDSSGCTKDTTIHLNNNGNFYFNTIARTPPSCFGFANGSITFIASGGTPPYQYAINGGAFSSANTYWALSAGTYTLHIIDNAGCFRDSVVNLSQPQPLSLGNTQLILPACPGLTNGSIQSGQQGGTPPYQYRINGGAWTSSPLFSSLGAGTYTLSIRDSKQCVKDSVILLADPLPVQFSNFNLLNPGCLGAYGAVNVTATGGTSPYTYSLNAGITNTTGSFLNLPVGIYTLNVADQSGCNRDSVFSVINSQQVSIDFIQYSPLVCIGAMNGFIHAQANSLALPILYSLNGGANQTTGYFNGLSAGVYSLHIEDQSGCFTDTFISISAAPPIQVTAVINSMPLCYNTTDGSIQIQAQAGVGLLQYAMGSGPYSISNQFANMAAGSYMLHVRDSLNCQLDTLVNLPAPLPLSFAGVNIVQPYCSNATDGKITISANGGTPPYQYAINTSLFTTNNVFQNLYQGNYTVWVMDYHGCLHDTVVFVQSANYMDFTNVSIQGVSCKFGNDGSISLSVTGGYNPYQFWINSVSAGSTGLFSNLITGNYTIKVMDSLGCEADTMMFVPEPLFPVQSQILQIRDNVCRGDSAGSITATAIGGTGPYTYSLDGTLFQASPFFSGLPSGYYSVFVKDANGCLDDTLAFVDEPDTSVQMFLVNIKDISCIHVNDGFIEVTAYYGYEPLTYYLNGNAVGIDTFYSSLAPGNYIVEVVDSLGCKSTGKFTIQPSDRRPYIIIDSLKGILCENDKDAMIDWHAVNTFPPYSYTFDSVYIGQTSMMGGLGSGTYLIQVTDSIGCYADTTITIEESNKMNLTVTPTAALCSGLGDDGKAVAVVEGGQAPFRFTWSGSPGNYTSNADPLIFGDHIAYVEDALGCVDTVHFEVEYDPCCLVSLPNAFSPNGDGNNDIFRAIRFGYVTLQSFEVYNRWGNRVFSTTLEQEGWDGKYQGVDCELGTYFYLLRYRCRLKNEIILLKGDVILLR